MLLAAVFVAKFAWLLAALAAAATIGRAVGWWLARRDDRAVERRCRDAEICARADRQHAQVLAGDDRGIYGQYLPAQLLPGV
jgi:membrane protein YqaA with SNARE-associated domain